MQGYDENVQLYVIACRIHCEIDNLGTEFYTEVHLHCFFA
jgi:hypothetical protein